MEKHLLHIKFFNAKFNTYLIPLSLHFNHILEQYKRE